MWIAFLDSDDVYLPDSIAKRLAAAEEEGTSIVHGECLVRTNDYTSPFGVPPMSGDVHKSVLKHPGPMFQALMVRAALLRRIGDLDESIVAYQEWETAIRLSRVGRFSFVGDPTFVYDLRWADGISKDALRSARGYEQVVRKHAQSMLRIGGPSMLAAHLHASARLHAFAGARASAWSRLVGAACVWPFDVRALASTTLNLIRA